VLTPLFGYGSGSGIAVIFFIVGMIGFVACFMSIKNPIYKSLDEGPVLVGEKADMTDH
jgi:DHA3 family macrolide efflux protein-like MFS transporter